MIEKLFKNNFLFISFLALLYGAIIMIVMEVRYADRLHSEIRNHVLTEIERMNKVHATRDELEKRTFSRWHAYDSYNYCLAVEKINPGFYCPNLSEILEAAKKDPSLKEWKQREHDHFKTHPHPTTKVESWKDRTIESN